MAADPPAVAPFSDEQDIQARDSLSPVVIHLLKGVIYQDSDPHLWNDLLALQARVRDYVSVLRLELTIDEAEGHAFLRARPDDENGDGGAGIGGAGTAAGSDLKAPRLIARRPLSFPVSLLLALLRKKLAEFDASGGETRLILTQEEILDLIRVFLPDTSNEARLVDQTDKHINKVIELGFLRRLRAGSGGESGTSSAKGGKSSSGGPYEVRRILKAYVDAQWLSELDNRLAEYRDQLRAPEDETPDD
ncbi:DUF4194 domain-containing protein [Thiorhodovibrio winogradskyi]|nr:DUF4194 domain-containing protein [Thiorhodovibrio winogradskyi]